MAEGGSERFARHPGRSGFSRDQLIDMLRECKAKGINPTTRDADQGRHGLASAKAFIREFGSFENAKREAGLGVSKRQQDDSDEPQHRLPTRGHL